MHTGQSIEGEPGTVGLPGMDGKPGRLGQKGFRGEPGRAYLRYVQLKKKLF